MVGLGVASPSVARLAHHALGRPGFGSDVDEILGGEELAEPIEESASSSICFWTNAPS